MTKNERSKQWRRDNPHKVQAYNKQYKTAHKYNTKEYRQAYMQTLAGRYASGKSMAKARHKKWDISKAEYACLLSHPCTYCGEKLNPTGCGLDRKNNSLDYVPGNVVACCKRCNTSKGEHFTYDEFGIMMKALLNFRRGK